MVTASIDFGTTNSVATITKNQKITTIKLGKNSSYTPTALFYNFDDYKFYVGDDAIKHLEEGEFGRYFVSLKSFLGSKENIKTYLGRKEYSLEDLIAIILKEFKSKIDKVANQNVVKLTLGRPVKFNDNDKELDKLAQDRLKNAAILAGFKEINFCFEPIAASLSYRDKLSNNEIILVADIGGGTTDYTIVDTTTNKILATNGVYIGGNSFDSKIIRNFISPHLGEGLKYKNMGKDMYISHSLYVDLYEYYKFIKMYDRQIIDAIKKYIQMAEDKEPIRRLLELIENGLYFDFISSIVNAKIDLTKNNKTTINMNFFNNPFITQLTRYEFEKVTKDEIKKIEQTLLQTIKQANLDKTKIDKVFLTGGTTLIPSVQKIFVNTFGKNRLIQTDVFSSVGYGLALCNKQFN